MLDEYIMNNIDITQHERYKSIFNYIKWQLFHSSSILTRLKQRLLFVPLVYTDLERNCFTIIVDFSLATIKQSNSMNNGFTSDASDLSYYLGEVWAHISTAGDGDVWIVSKDCRVTAVGFFVQSELTLVQVGIMTSQIWLRTYTKSSSPIKVDVTWLRMRSVNTLNRWAFLSSLKVGRNACYLT